MLRILFSSLAPSLKKRLLITYIVIAASLTVSIEAEIRSTKTSEQLWKYTGTVVVDLSGGNAGGGGLAGLVVSAIATAINTAASVYVTHAHTANGRFLYTLPLGPYHKQYLQDQQQDITHFYPDHNEN